ATVGDQRPRPLAVEVVDRIALEVERQGGRHAAMLPAGNAYLDHVEGGPGVAQRLQRDVTAVGEPTAQQRAVDRRREVLPAAGAGLAHDVPFRGRPAPGHPEAAVAAVQVPDPD